VPVLNAEVARIFREANTRPLPWPIRHLHHVRNGAVVVAPDYEREVAELK